MPHVRELCDEIYSQLGIRKRTEYHLLGISLVEDLIRTIAREPQQQHQGGNSEYAPSFPSLPYPYEEVGFPLWYMVNTNPQPVNTNEVPDFNPPLDPTAFRSAPPGAPMASGTPTHIPMTSDASETPSDTFTVSPAPLSDVAPDVPIPSSFRPTPPAQTRPEGSDTLGPSTLASSGQKVQANERCEICGYRPKGDPQWFKGSMAKHKKMQHSTNPPVIYKCPFPGCNSEYKNRRDNLRQHQIEKDHFVGDELTHRPKKRRRDHA